ncbi:MAG: MBL fold metallo-hydrolase [Planctomycetota bacterium]
MIASLQITALIENHSLRSDLFAEHGLSLWVQADGFSFLFDVGQSGAFIANARVLGIPLEKADAIVLSHGHYDHTGGLAFLAGDGGPGRICLHPAAVLPRYRRNESSPHKFVGMPAASAAFVDRRGSHVIWTSAATWLSGGIGITGTIRRTIDFEDAGNPFFLDLECATPDLIPDDQAVWVETEKGIVVLCGCAHAGVVNTLEQVRRETGNGLIHAVVGGLHLRGAGRDRIVRTVEALNRFGVRRLAAGHCTGEEAQACFAECFEGVLEPLSAGSVWDL